MCVCQLNDSPCVNLINKDSIGIPSFSFKIMSNLNVIKIFTFLDALWKVIDTPDNLLDLQVKHN